MSSLINILVEQRNNIYELVFRGYTDCEIASKYAVKCELIRDLKSGSFNNEPYSVWFSKRIING